MDTFVTPVQEPAAAPAGIVRLNQLTKLLMRHLWLLAMLAVLGAAGALAYARTLPKTFTASTAFVVEGERFAIPELQGALRADNSPDPMPWVRTEVQALTSRALVAQVAYRQGLDKLPEFNPALRPPTVMHQLKDLVGAWLPAPAPGPAGVAAPQFDEAVVSAVSKALSVFQDNRSLVINVSFSSQDPQRSAGFLNALVAEYIQSRAQRRLDVNQDANQAIGQRVEKARADLADIEAQMRDLRSRNELVGLRAGSVGQQQLEELTTAAARATLERSQLEINTERAAAAARDGSSDALASVLNSPTVSRLRDQEAAASRRMAELSTRYGPDYPGVRSASAELGSVRRQVAAEAGRIVSSLQAQLRVARAQEADVKQQLDKARRAGVQSENIRAQMQELQQEATSRRNLYQTLLERSQQTVVQPAGERTVDVRVLSAAVPPGGPSGPNAKIAGLMGGAGGTLLGCLIALARIRSVDRFDTAGELTSATGLPVLATVPRGLLRARRVSPQAAEAMRLLRSRLRFSGRGGRPRAVLFVPVLPGGTAAAVAVLFARVAADDGERVLLAEGDLAEPRMAAMLQGQPGGLARVLSGADWRDTVALHGQDGRTMDLLLAARPANSQALLNNAHLQNLLVEARDEYDVAVLDAPPATASDAAVLAALADVTVLVVDSRAGQAAVQDAASRMGAGRTPAVAVLVTRR